MKIRFCDIHGIKEVSELEYGMDFREPQYRREVFHRFYEFHLKHKAFAGAVYYALPYLFERLKMTTEQKLWLCFLNGCTQNILTAFEIWQRFPDFDKLDLNALSVYFRERYNKFGFDTDRRYHKNTFEKHVEKYAAGVSEYNSQEEYLTEGFGSDMKANFERLWTLVLNEFYGFGRLASFSYIEYLKIAGLKVECSTLFLYDLSGSKSHRNGLCKVLGRDDLDWYKSNKSFDGKYSDDILRALVKEAETLLIEAQLRWKKTHGEYNFDISYFTLETALCTYKGMHRPNRRYPNVYNDMFFDRIKHHGKFFKKTAQLFLEMRRDCLPDYLRVESNPADGGLTPLKQNWYRETGEVVMMHKDWSCFKNGYNDFVEVNNKL